MTEPTNRGIVLRKMIRSRIRELLGPIAIILVIYLPAHGQAFSMNHVELASHARSAARSLSDSGEYEAALKVLNSLAAGKYEFGDGATQALAARIQGVLTDKGRLLIKLGRHTDADAEFYRAFDANIVQGEKDLRYVQENGTGGPPASGSRAAEAFVSAAGSVSRAKAVIDLRDASYLLSGAANAAKPFDPVRMAKYESLRKGVARFIP
jgi:tetratricopeptide (TPR) repeat protein